MTKLKDFSDTHCIHTSISRKVLPQALSPSIEGWVGYRNQERLTNHKLPVLPQ